MADFDKDPTPRTKYSDDVLDLRFKTIDAEIEKLRTIPERLVRIEQGLLECHRDTREVAASLDRLSTGLQDERKEQIRERKSDRRAIVGTMIASAGLVVSAIALFADKL